LYPFQNRNQSDLWQFERPAKSAEHPTMKPIALAAKAVSNSSRAGDAVLDLFGGSGTTLLACEQCGRINYSMELDPKYCDVIVTRYIKFCETDSGVFLLRNGEKIPCNEIPQT
jgi:DNA modification methylase